MRCEADSAAYVLGQKLMSVSGSDALLCVSRPPFCVTTNPRLVTRTKTLKPNSRIASRTSGVPDLHPLKARLLGQHKLALDLPEQRFSPGLRVLRRQRDLHELFAEQTAPAPASLFFWRSNTPFRQHCLSRSRTAGRPSPFPVSRFFWFFWFLEATVFIHRKKVIHSAKFNFFLIS